MSQIRTQQTSDRQVTVAEVVGTQQVSPHLVRVTLCGLEAFAALGADQWFRLFLPRAGQDVLKLPTRTSSWGWYLQYLATPKARRPWVRAYTVRSARPELGEIDVDFVVHVDDDGHAGPGATFALTARAGDTVGILDQGVGFAPPTGGADWMLLVADETALPAVAGICESLPADARGVAIVEVPTAEDAQDLRVPDGVQVRWVHRDEVGAAHDIPGRAALEVLRAADLPAGTVHAQLMGEAALATGARRHLVNDRGVPKSSVTFTGYWRHGRAAAG